ncbi:N(6)-adenine-specific methyltransferase METTL4-like [Styela clava]
MSIIKHKGNGILVDHGKFTKEIYRGCRAQSQNSISSEFTHVKLAYKDIYFGIQSPHLSREKDTLTSRRCKKRKLPENEEEVSAKMYHLTVSPMLQEMTKNLALELANENNSLCEQQSQKLLEDFSPKCTICSDLCRNLCLSSILKNASNIAITGNDPIHLAKNDADGKLVRYIGETPRTICFSNEVYLLPTQCTFLLSELGNMEPLIRHSMKSGGFNIIVIDPPWENKSAKRGSKYPWLSLKEILSVPLDKLMDENCLVFVWVTNKQKYHKFIRNDLFPKYNIHFTCEWHWVKVTTQGQPVFDFDSVHKRPYETIIIGQTWKHKCNEKHIEPTVITSVPCTIHSHKPPLDKIIRTLVTDFPNPKCLELFARNLLPKWTSWGNEVLEMQHIKHFQAKNQN